MLRDSITGVQFSTRDTINREKDNTTTHTHDLAVADVLSATLYMNSSIGWITGNGL